MELRELPSSPHSWQLTMVFQSCIVIQITLEENDTLLSLYLENNYITHVGAKEIGRVLANKYKLSKINLNNNPLKDDGLIAVA